MLSEANFGLKGILVHRDSVPSPGSYGTTPILHSKCALDQPDLLFGICGF